MFLLGDYDAGGGHDGDLPNTIINGLYSAMDTFLGDDPTHTSSPTFSPTYSPAPYVGPPSVSKGAVAGTVIGVLVFIAVGGYYLKNWCCGKSGSSENTSSVENPLSFMQKANITGEIQMLETRMQLGQANRSEAVSRIEKLQRKLDRG